MPGRALVLAGGGARGAYQVGMLERLVLEDGLDFDILRGVSVGALNASFLAQAAKGTSAATSLANLGNQVRALANLWTREIRGNRSIYTSRGGFLALVGGADSLYDVEPLERLLRIHVSPRLLRESARDFRVGTVSLVSGRYREWTPADARFLERVMASAAIPVVFPFRRFEDESEILVDGGARNITPLKSAFAARPDEIYVLLTSRLVKDGPDLPDSGVRPDEYRKWEDNLLGTRVSGLGVLERTVEILTDEIYLDDIRSAVEWNEVVRKVNAIRAAAGAPGAVESAVGDLSEYLGKREVKLQVLAPREWFGAENDSTSFDPRLIAEAIRHGREVAADPGRWLVHSP